MQTLRYTSLVNQIHPERCMDGRAEQAFVRASEAYAQASESPATLIFHRGRFVCSRFRLSASLGGARFAQATSQLTGCSVENRFASSTSNFLVADSFARATDVSRLPFSGSKCIA